MGIGGLGFKVLCDQKRGRTWMQEIGKRGFRATVDRYFDGDSAAYLRVQRARAWEHGVGGFVDRVLQERLDKGERIASVELPVVCDPEEDGVPF
ncbi:hypothetical protein SAMN05444166_1420 [Singulisphaera sp. GP187]|uniref:hypothetical protein n=1 Tax=Singulisphaera sp. GP187 TaxID=1882752 RepID=UPI0009288E51|nr:hypothetical protein [Singulisphaera sp. GP187]SIN88155.1 hypothetical protein SAMN05444166_1420 [Singulisphaera sp. GP187]